jgi:hypothetical protein
MEITTIFIVSIFVTNYISFRWGFSVGQDYAIEQIARFLNLALPEVLKDQSITPDEFKVKMEVERVKLKSGLK